MNWRRGLVRLWVVASCLWIAFVFSVALNDRGPEPVDEVDVKVGRIQYEVLAPEGLSRPAVNSWVKAQGVEKDDAFCDMKVFHEWCKDPVVMQMPRRTVYYDVWKNAGIATAGPLALLAAGGIVAWIAAGFRRRPAKS